MFDISTLDTLTLSEEGVEMPVIHPRTKEPVLGSDGRQITITMLGRMSADAQAAFRRVRDRQNERVQQGRRTTPEDVERDQVDILVACTRAWTFSEMDGTPFPFTQANADRLWRDPRFRWLREQAFVYVNDDGNFIRD